MGYNAFKNFTALYGGAATYGKLYGEEMISTIAIGGFMYKGKISKALEVIFEDGNRFRNLPDKFKKDKKIIFQYY